jgi:carbonic anhydrase
MELLQAGLILPLGIGITSTVSSMNSGGEIMLDRRSFLRASGLAAVAACPLCRAAVAAEAPHWTYEEAAHWGDLAPDFKACAVGAEQSPVDLTQPIPSALHDVTLAWQPVTGAVVNNGHTIQVNTAPGSSSEIAGTSYDLAQFHFHHPSEHSVDGERSAMELHFVHRAAAGGLAVIGVLLVPGAESETLAKIWAKMPAKEGKAALEGPLDLLPLLPKSRAYYRYAGSLTTPPCSETVLWTVFAEPVELSQAQIDAFAALYPMNARPLQQINRRFLLGSF